jgi:hypothetical protein
MMQVSVSCLNRLPLAFADNHQIQDSGSGISGSTHSSLSPDAMIQVSEQNLSVSYKNHSPLAFADNCQIKDSGSGLLANARNTLITGGTFVVSLSCWLYKQLIIVHILFARTMSTFSLPILEKSI